MTQNETLLSKVTNTVQAALKKVCSDQNLGRPVNVWDGALRSMLIENHEEELVLAEVHVIIEMFPHGALPEDVQEVGLGITARAWSYEHRKGTQDRQIYRKILENVADVPSIEEFEALLVKGIDKARELIPKIAEAVIAQEQAINQLRQEDKGRD